jgi:hypothetical protein
MRGGHARGGKHSSSRASGPDSPARLTIIGLSLVVIIGVLVFLAGRQPGPSRAARVSPGSSATGVASASSAPPVTALGTGGPTHASPHASASRGAARSAAAHPAVRRGDPLGASAASYLAARSGVVVAAVYDLGSRQSWTLGSTGRAQAEASVVKVDILETILARQPGGLPAADRALAQQMMEDSSNDAATTLWNAVGGASGIRSFNAVAGLSGTTPSSCVQCPGFPWPGWGLSTTTPLDQITLLRELVEPAGVISAADRAFALGLMENVTPSQRWGVSGGVPAQATIALKNGWLPLDQAGTDWQINSVGWVSGLGRNYLIAVLSTGNPTEAYGIDTIGGLSSIVWNSLG